jgi:hypothetical protein
MAPGEKYWYMVIIYGTNDYKFCCLLPVLQKRSVMDKYCSMKGVIDKYCRMKCVECSFVFYAKDKEHE